MNIYVLVADSSKARLFSATDGNSDLHEAFDFSHSDSRLKEQELVADGTGSASDSGGYGKHSVGHEKAEHQHQAEIFAHHLGTELDRIRQHHKPHKIYLVAAPKFLGNLRACLNKQCTALLAGEIDKNLVTHSIKDIRAHLPRYL